MKTTRFHRHRRTISGWLLAVGLLLGGLAPAGAAEPKLDRRTTVLPTYVLPDTAAADGKLEEWAAIPPSATSGQFLMESRLQGYPAPTTLAVELRCGMKKESNDLFVLVTVRDSHRYSEERPTWMVSDNLELFLDYGREARDTAFPEWWRDNNKYANVPEMAQFGLRPRTINGEACVIPAGSAKGWTIDYKSVLIEGGMAYEIRIDAASALGKLGLKQLPARIGFDILVGDRNYPLALQTEGYSNEASKNLLFGEVMDFLYASLYGMVSLRPVAAPAGVQAPPRTLEARYGFPTVEDVAKGVGVLAPDALADLVYWAGCNNVAFTEPLVAKLMTDPSPLVREACLAVLCFSKQEQPMVKAGIEAAYKELAVLSPAAVVLANMTNERYALGHAPRLHELLASPDITVAVSAARALAKVGTAEDIPVLDKALATALARIATQPNLSYGVPIAYNVWMKAALDELKNRTEPITIPAFTPTWQPKAENSDLPRLMPVSGNNVYNGRGLLRTWPKDGPKELWRVEVGEGKAAVTEAGGRAFTAAQFDGKQWALCLNPATGATIWKHEIYPKAWIHITNGPVVTPLVDGNRVYFIPKMDAGYDPISPVYCLNAEDGAEVWRSDDNEYFAQPDATPLIVDDTLYIPAAKRGKGQILVAVDKLTGKLLWGVKDPQNRQMIYGSSASPNYQIIDGKGQVIFGVYGAAREAWGIDAATGEVLWTYPTPMHHSLICSPVAEGSRVFLAGGQGQVSFSACLQMYIKDGKIRARQVYNSPLQCSMYNTAAILDGAVYSFGGTGLQCTDFETGALLWESKGKDGGQQLIVADGLIYALSTGGDLVMLEANKTGYRELGRVATKIKLGIPQQPTIANGRLYVRGDTEIVCYDLLKDGERAAAGPETPGVKDGGTPPQKNAGSATGLRPDGSAENWPGFRGPGGLATGGDGKAPTTAAGIGRIRWKVDLSHSGRGSPVVWGDHVFLTGADKAQGVVYCFETSTGRQLWRRECPLTGPASPMEETGYAAPTPATDGNRVCAIFATGDVVAFDMNGTPAWQAKLGENTSAYGYASSLVLYQNLLLIQYDQQENGAEGGSALLALDAQTGKTAWRAKRNLGPSWSTPLVIGTRRGPQIIVCANNGIAAYAPEDGREIWTVHRETQDLVPVPAIAGGLIIATMTGSGTIAISPDGQGDVTKTHVAWSKEDAVADVPSPVGFGDLFFRLFSGKLTCHKAADGKEVGSLDLDGEFYASPIVCDGALLLLDRDGTMTAVKAGPALEKIGTLAVGKLANSSPAIADGRMFVRTDKTLLSIDKLAQEQVLNPRTTALPTDPASADDDLEELAGIPTEGPTEGLWINKALVGKVDVSHVLQGKVKDNRLVIVATSAFFGMDVGNEKLVVEYVLDGKQQTIELSPIPGDALSVGTAGADWLKGVAVLGASKPLPAKGLGVKLAIYGNVGSWVDVTEKCNAMIANDKLTLAGREDYQNLARRDPYQGAKYLFVAYVLDGKEGTTSCDHGDELTIPPVQQEWAAIPPLKATFSRKIEARNTDLNRFIPVDGNTVYNAAGLLRTWPKNGPTELWRLKTGPSIGTTVESGGRAFATGQLDGKQWAYCLEAKTGKIIWKTEIAPEFMVPNHWWGTVASPLVDEDRVYYIPYGRLGDVHHQITDGEVCSLVCLRVSDGKELWRSGGDIPYVNGFSTPLVVGGTLFALPKRVKDNLVALDKISGKVLWTGEERKSASCAPYAGASPTYLELDGQGQLIYGLGSGEIAGVSVKDGSILWTIKRRSGHGLMASAVAVSNRVFLSCGESRFSMCIELKKREGQYLPKIVYESSSNQQNFYHTPSIHEGAVYGFSTYRLQCTSLDSGELLWEQSEPRDWDTKQQLIIADGLIFALTKNKELVMAEANKTGYKELGRVSHGLDLKHTQQPTIANGRLYIRGFDTVVCYQLTEALLENAPDWGSSVKPQ